MARLDIEADARRALETLQAGGIAILPHSCGYGIFGGTAEAVDLAFRTKQRGGHKRNTLICDVPTRHEIHQTDARTRDMIDAISIDYDLPLAAIAPYRADHPLLRDQPKSLLAGCTAKGNISIFCNAGVLTNALTIQAREAGQVIVGSSANLTGTGQKFRLEDVQAPVRAVADLQIDYGLGRYHFYKRSATIINFVTEEVVRIGACYEQIADILKRHFDWDIPPDPGLETNPSGHLQEFALLGVKD